MANIGKIISLLGKAKSIEPKIMDVLTMPRAKAVTKRKLATLREWDLLNYKSEPTKIQKITNLLTGKKVSMKTGGSQHNIKLKDDTAADVAKRKKKYDEEYNKLLTKNLGHLRNQTRLGVYSLTGGAGVLGDDIVQRRKLAALKKLSGTNE